MDFDIVCISTWKYVRCAWLVPGPCLHVWLLPGELFVMMCCLYCIYLKVSCVFFNFAVYSCLMVLWWSGFECSYLQASFWFNVRYIISVLISISQPVRRELFWNSVLAVRNQTSPTDSIIENNCMLSRLSRMSLCELKSEGTLLEYSANCIYVLKCLVHR